MIKSRTLVIFSGILAFSAVLGFAQDEYLPLEEAEAQQEAELIKKADEAAKKAEQASKKQETPVKQEALSAAAPKEPIVIMPSAPAPAPKAKAPAAPAAVSKPSVPAGPVLAEWEFLRVKGEDADEDVREHMLPQLTDWLARNPENENAAEALLLKARLHLKLDDYRYALIDLLRFQREYPQAASAAEADKLFAETLEKKADKRSRGQLAEIAKIQEPGDKADKLAYLLEMTAERVGAAFYEPLISEFREFFNRFPLYGKSDELRLTLADLHFKREEYLHAKLAYEKMIRMSPASKLLARAKNSLGQVLSDHLKDYDAAITVYRDIAETYPGTGEAWTAYGRLPKLAEKQKQFQLAVDTYEKIIALFPDKPESYGAFQAEARVLREELARPAEAAAVLNRLADKYTGERAIEALFLAAEIARKDMKNPVLEVKTYARIAAEYPAGLQAPRALFAAAEVYENEKNLDKTREYYAKVIEKYADNPLAKKAQKRLDALNGK